MPQLAVRNMEGEKVGQVDIPEDLLGLPLNLDLVHQALCVVDNQRHVGRHRVLSRGEITATTAKWYRQKGLGRARHGSRTANLFAGGQKAHGPQGAWRPLHLPRKMRRKALLSVLSEQVRDGVVTVLAGFDLPEISTGAVARVLSGLGCEGRTLLVLSPEEYRDQTLYLSCRNLPGLLRREVPHFSVRDVIWADDILITQAALERLQAVYEEEE